MQRRYAIVLIGALVATMISGDSRPDRADAVQTGAMQASTMPTGAAGQVITLDPVTGKVRPGVAQATDLQSILGDAISTSDEGLVVEKSPVAGGGVMINLQGRFQNAATATIDAEGNLSAPCVTGSADDAPAPAGEGK